jgi:glycosyltransferase involved in cell wall biosynthesis
MKTPAGLDLSVVIITLNEEKKIARCIQSIPDGCEIIVLDSGSRDSTTRLASELGAQVHARPFDNYAAQKNAASSFANRSWVLILDADEVIDSKLSRYLSEAFGGDSSQLIPKANVLRVKRQLVFMGRILRFGGASDQPIRLFKKGTGAFVGKVHEVYTPDPATAVSTVSAGHILHYSYDDLTDYFAKFNLYTSRMAEEHTRKAGSFEFIQVLRPWYEFFVRYVLKLGFLDAYEGYCYAYISSVYKFVKYAKIRELKQKAGK